NKKPSPSAGFFVCVEENQLGTLPSHHTVIPEWGYRESILTLTLTLTLTCSSPKSQVNMDSR
ncbi:hypothetical protein, partial [Vreelandella alkaliphila]|uniref:hypothetical protein n=1 Tax=Vreelandella alkaliphila TaxID=272774 RepID=UPI003FD834F9